MAHNDRPSWELALSSRMLVFVNGKKIELEDVDPETSLLTFLRSLGLSGTKLGCNEGGCGACTVMVSHFDGDRICHRSVNACLAPLVSVDSCAVTTVEGIGDVKSGLHPVQERIAKLHGSQCGFCTPGIVMALYTFLRNNPRPTAAQVEKAMDGNLCRCTGYRPILDAAKSFASDTFKCCGGRGGEGCCMSAKKEAADAAGRDDVKVTGFTRVTSTTTSKLNAEFMSRKLDGEAQLIFPSYLQVSHTIQPLCLVGKEVKWFRPTSLEGLLQVRSAYPESKIVGGSTEVSIETNFKNAKYAVRVSVAQVPELRKVIVYEPKAGGDVVTSSAATLFAEDVRGGLEVGGSVTIAELGAACAAQIKAHPARSRSLVAVHEMVEWFASAQIRNVALLAGNLATASPVSELNPTLMAVGAVIKILNAAGEARLVPVRDFFVSYRRTVLRAGDVIASVFIPFTRAFEYAMGYQQARRREDDIAVVGASFRVRLHVSDGSWVVAEAASGLAAMAATTIHASATCEWLVGKPWSREVLQGALERLQSETGLPAGVPGGLPDFRSAAVASFFFKFFLRTASQLCEDIEAAGADAGLPPPPTLVAPEEMSAVDPYEREVSHGTQTYDLPPSLMHTVKGITVEDDEAKGDADASAAGAGSGAGGEEGLEESVGGNFPHRSGEMQVTGEAVYVDDMPDPARCAHMVLVLSSKPRAKVVKVDTSAAEASEGFISYISGADVPGLNSWGIASPYEEEVFATEEVTHFGQAIGGVVCETRKQATAAAKLVQVSYEDLPAVFTIKEAIAAGSYFREPMHLANPEADSALEKAEHSVEGEVLVGGQEHFYLETNATLAIPAEARSGIVLYCSTQAPSKTQMATAKSLHLPASRVVVRVKRVGGGFGGKETRSVPFSVAVAVAANKLNRPVRINLERDVDMVTSGQRHSFLCKYKVGFTSDGTVTALKAELYLNAGASLDLSPAVLKRAILHAENAYNFQNVDVKGWMCKTNKASNTAFRGFGGPQGMVVGDTALDHVARTLGLPVDEVRHRNLYKIGDATPYGQPVTHWYVPEMWDKLQASAEVAARRSAVEAFNKANKYRKRGICTMPTKYGINFGQKFLNQGSAMVHIYVDGTVLITHGGVEIGQGLHTKVIQIAAHNLGVPVEDCHIDETATDKIPNASPTAASSSSDIYGEATRRACVQLNERLAPYRKANPGADMATIARAAYMDRVQLSAQGFYAVEQCGLNQATMRGSPWAYFTNGLAVAEVEIDTLTGDFHVLRTDILMDLASPINPGIDIGQIEGAFVQGMGWCTIEEGVWGDREHAWLRPGDMLTKGPGFYKIPSFNDIPIDLRVSLLQDAPHAAAVHSSKAVGEPPFYLGITVFFAIKEAIYAARADNGVTGYFTLDLPATCARIRMACVDDITARRLGGMEKAAAHRVQGCF